MRAPGDGGLAAAVVAAAVWLSACGPVEYTSQVTRRASADVAAAKLVHADKRAPYWYTLAVEYLRQARVEAAEADFQAATRFGRRASEAARRARQLSVEAAATPGAKDGGGAKGAPR